MKQNLKLNFRGCCCGDHKSPEEMRFPLFYRGKYTTIFFQQKHMKFRVFSRLRCEKEVPSSLLRNYHFRRIIMTTRSLFTVQLFLAQNCYESIFLTFIYSQTHTHNLCTHTQTFEYVEKIGKYCFSRK